MALLKKDGKKPALTRVSGGGKAGEVSSLRPQAIEMALGARGIAVRAGLHCAPWAHKWLGTVEGGGTVRTSLGYFSLLNDVETVIEFLQNM